MRIIIATLLALLATPLAAQEMTTGRLTVTGSGAVRAAPDMATITMGVTSEARSAGAALDATSVATAAVLARLNTAGIAPRDIQTRDLSLSPVWNDRVSNSDQRPEITGFEATNTLVVRVRKLGDLGGILDAVVQSGANDFRGLRFGLQDPGPALDEARRLAVADALRKAALYAGAAGIELGEVMQISEGGGIPVPVMLEVLAMPSPVPVAAGEISTTASINMVFAIGGQ